MYLYHCTPKNRLESIRKHGLCVQFCESPEWYYEYDVERRIQHVTQRKIIWLSASPIYESSIRSIVLRVNLDPDTLVDKSYGSRFIFHAIQDISPESIERKGWFGKWKPLKRSSKTRSTQTSSEQSMSTWVDSETVWSDVQP